MSAYKRDISETYLLQFLKDAKLTVPVYQRPYAWDEYNHKALWKDVENTFHRQQDNSDGFKHFMSSLLVQDARGDHRRHIVDGQQRLLTLTIFLRAALSILEENGLRNRMHDHLKEALYSTKYDDNEEKQTVPSIILENQDPGNHYAQMMNTTGSYKVVHPRSKIEKAYKFFYTKLQDVYAEDTKKFYGFVQAVLTGLQFVVIPIFIEESPQQIFESVNGLPKELLAGELIKNYVLLSSPNEEFVSKIYNKYWFEYDRDEWADGIRDSKKPTLSEFIFYYTFAHKSEQAKNKEKAIYQDFKEIANFISITNVQERQQKIEQVSHELHNFISTYERLSAQRGVPKTRLELFYSRVLRPNGSPAQSARSTLFLLVSMMDQLKTTYGEDLPYTAVDALVKYVEGYIIRRIFSKSGYSSINTRLINKYVKLSHEASIKENTLEEYLAVYTRTLQIGLLQGRSPNNRWETLQDMITILAGNLERGDRPREIKEKEHPLVNMLLTEVENYLQKKHLSAFHSQSQNFYDGSYTVEHWMPQTPGEGQWQLQSNLNRDFYTNSLGNLALIPGSLNSMLNNKALADKVMIVQQHNVQRNQNKTSVYTFDSIMQACENTLIWTEPQIQTRGEWLARIAFGEIFKDIDFSLSNSLEQNTHQTRHGVVRRNPTHDNIDMMDLIKSGIIPLGTALKTSHSRFTHVTATVTEDGILMWDSTLHKSPSSAAKHVVERPVNGWTFWRFDNGGAWDTIDYFKSLGKN